MPLRRMACHSKGFQSRLPDFYQGIAYRASSSCEQPKPTLISGGRCRCIVVRCLRARQGELAQLVERVHGMDEVSGSSPLFSTSDQAQGQETSTSPRHTSSSIGVSATCLRKALLQFLEGAADISSGVSHVRLATEAEVNCLLDRRAINDVRSSTAAR